MLWNFHSIPVLLTKPLFSSRLKKNNIIDTMEKTNKLINVSSVQNWCQHIACAAHVNRIPSMTLVAMMMTIIIMLKAFLYLHCCTTFFSKNKVKSHSKLGKMKQNRKNWVVKKTMESPNSKRWIVNYLAILNNFCCFTYLITVYSE